MDADDIIGYLIRMFFLFHLTRGMKKLFTGRWVEIRLIQWVALALFWGFQIMLFVVMAQERMLDLWAESLLFLAAIGALCYAFGWVVNRIETARVNACARRGVEAFAYDDSFANRARDEVQSARQWFNESPFAPQQQQSSQQVLNVLHIDGHAFQQYPLPTRPRDGYDAWQIPYWVENGRPTYYSPDGLRGWRDGQGNLYIHDINGEVCYD